MGNTIVRIENVEIRNFKNVDYGYLSFENTRKDFNASILGLYGQNGSGKTALIDALELLRLILSGQSVPEQFANYINVDSNSATLKYRFKVSNKSEQDSYAVQYEFSIRKDSNDSGDSAEQADIPTDVYKATIFNEVLSYSYENSIQKIKIKSSPIVNTRTEEVFIPTTKYRILVGNSKETKINLMVAKKYSEETSRSFIFSRQFLEAIRQNCAEKYHLSLFESLVFFGKSELFVINTANSGLISMNVLPLAFRYKVGHRASIGSLALNLHKPFLIPQDAVDLVEKVIRNMNVVLTQLVPGLTIDLKNLGPELDSKGRTQCRVQLVSNRNNKEIPLQCESEGIKKIISILQLLIVVYNQPSMTVAIDELDSGIFEYLLGELLRIISEKGKGQLIFTSHNLRTLETLDKGFIAFTTTNPQNRYIRLNNVKTSNNLRDFYYRDIVLGEQSEPVYESTNNYEIALAFREAGGTSAS